MPISGIWTRIFQPGVTTVMRLTVIAAAALSVLNGAAAAQSSPAPAGARLYIIWPKNGQVIEGGKLWLRMGLRNMGVAPANVEWPETGHHHVLIDTEPPPPGERIPNDRNNLHFGNGQSEARIELAPGKHTLQLILGDHAHFPFNPPLVSEKITVIVPGGER